VAQYVGRATPSSRCAPFPWAFEARRSCVRLSPPLIQMKSPHSHTTDQWVVQTYHFLGEPLIIRVAVWQQFHLNQWFAKSHHKTSWKSSLMVQWPRGLRQELSSLPRTLGSWVRIPLKAWMSMCVYSVFVLFCVHVERPCEGLIRRPRSPTDYVVV
jgi:hypothetical protein